MTTTTYYIEADLPDSGPTLIGYQEARGAAERQATREAARLHCYARVIDSTGRTVAEVRP